ncbi:hypothetical protein AM587_10002575 [Phytophthora nicotianae]|uniref:Uncharacterized protein n=1 Tax=Phytophthora nicotianae TaxID=4792 RepID=A0A0W8CWH5_PHYNI|nr:hypothetical protein AM587_10002575 [Phytophthora nicotianae]
MDAQLIPTGFNFSVESLDSLRSFSKPPHFENTPRDSSGITSDAGSKDSAMPKHLRDEDDQATKRTAICDYCEKKFSTRGITSHLNKMHPQTDSRQGHSQENSLLQLQYP